MPRQMLSLLIFALLAVVLQTTLVSVLLPGFMRPDLFLLGGFTILAFCGKDVGLTAVFAMGLLEDFFCSARLGMAAICFLLAAALILSAAWRQFSCGDVMSAWVGIVAGTIAVHGMYCVGGWLLGLEVEWSRALVTVFARGMANAVWGLPIIYGCGKLLFLMGAQTQTVHSRWAEMQRKSQSRRGAYSAQ